MLSNLLIKNYALIRELEIQPALGLNIITGETGAGKSIMLGAIGLLMGNRADTKVLLQKEQKCVIEGTFDLETHRLQTLFKQNDWEYHSQTIIRREISPAGKSRAFINDSPVNLDSLRSLGEYLLDIHSQNDTMKLGGKQFQIQVLDILGHNGESLQKYHKMYDLWTSLKREYEALLNRSQQQQQESDYHQFLLNELDAMSLEVDEEIQLQESLQQLEHAEEIKTQIHTSLQALTYSDFNASQLLSEAGKSIFKVKQYGTAYSALLDRIESSRIELQDIVDELVALDDQVVLDPDQLETVKARLDAIYRLQKKHGVNSVKELIEIKTRLENESNELAEFSEKLSGLEQRINESEQEMMAVGKSLSDNRIKTFPQFKQQLESLLGKLGMPESQIEISHRITSPGPDGLDDIRWLFSANKGVDPQPIGKVASGGEFSRMMFCVKYLLAHNVALPTILFDEIDTGISGEVALQMIEMMHRMSTNHQVLTISHLPQFAARADHHYYVYKQVEGELTTSGIRKLEDSERIYEIAKMLGGNNPSDIAFANAKELMLSSN